VAACSIRPDCGHYVAEERPRDIATEILAVAR